MNYRNEHGCINRIGKPVMMDVYTEMIESDMQEIERLSDYFIGNESARYAENKNLYWKTFTKSSTHTKNVFIDYINSTKMNLVYRSQMQKEEFEALKKLFDR